MQLVRTEHAHEAKLIFLVSGHTMEAKVLVQLIWLKNKGGRVLGGGRIFEKLRYVSVTRQVESSPGLQNYSLPGYNMGFT